jgi:hypothetical protein
MCPGHPFYIEGHERQPTVLVLVLGHDVRKYNNMRDGKLGKLGKLSKLRIRT